MTWKFHSGPGGRSSPENPLDVPMTAVQPRVCPRGLLIILISDPTCLFRMRDRPMYSYIEMSILISDAYGIMQLELGVYTRQSTRMILQGHLTCIDVPANHNKHKASRNHGKGQFLGMSHVPSDSFSSEVQLLLPRSLRTRP